MGGADYSLGARGNAGDTTLEDFVKEATGIDIEELKRECVPAVTTTAAQDAGPVFVADLDCEETYETIEEEVDAIIALKDDLVVQIQECFSDGGATSNPASTAPREMTLLAVDCAALKAAVDQLVANLVQTIQEARDTADQCLQDAGFGTPNSMQTAAFECPDLADAVAGAIAAIDALVDDVVEFVSQCAGSLLDPRRAGVDCSNVSETIARLQDAIAQMIAVLQALVGNLPNLGDLVQDCLGSVAASQPEQPDGAAEAGCSIGPLVQGLLR